MTAIYHEGDLPDGLDLGAVVAVDTEATGLSFHRDRLCLVQLFGGAGQAHLLGIEKDQRSAPNLCALLQDPARLKLFHFARFDIGMLAAQFGVFTGPVYCTKIASRLVRTYTDRHGLRELCSELLGVDLSKASQSSDWAARPLSDAQAAYAAADVLHLHALRKRLDMMLEREGRQALAQACFDFLPERVRLDLAGWPELDIFAH